MQEELRPETRYHWYLDEVLHGVPVVNYLDRPFTEGLWSIVRDGRGHGTVGWV